MDGLKEYLKSLPSRGLKVSLRTKGEYMDFLKGKYGINTDISQMAYMFMNDMDSPPIAACGDVCKFENISIGYSEFCTKPKFGKNKCKECSELVQNKKRETSIEKYGCENPAQAKEIRAKIDATNMERYGTTKPQQLDSVKRKTINTNIEKYGVEHSSKLDENKKKRKKTVIEKYGVHNTLVLAKTSLEERYTEYKRRYYAIGFNLLTSMEQYDEIGAHGIMKWECNECKRVMEKVDQCLRCPTCNPYSSSSEEIELRSFIESILPPETEINYNIRSLIANREIDIYIPSLKVGIEYCGDYWHSSDKKDINYHQEKHKMMEDTGNKLITIFGSSWITKKDIIKERLKYILGVVETRKYARKCSVKEIDHATARIFLNERHIQGSCVSSINIGLFDSDDSLVSVMTFGKTRFTESYEYELLRFCSNGSVVGAAGKLLKYFEKKFNPVSLQSYADLNWGNGNLYKTLGFKLSHKTKPNYFYFDPKYENVYSRHQCKKQTLIKKYGFDKTLTEAEMVKKLRWHKVYDCGSLCFYKKY